MFFFKIKVHILERPFLVSKSHLCNKCLTSLCSKADINICDPFVFLLSVFSKQKYIETHLRSINDNRLISWGDATFKVVFYFTHFKLFARHLTPFAYYYCETRRKRRQVTSVM